MDNKSVNVKVNDSLLEKVSDCKLPGVNFDCNLKWNVHITEVVSSVYGKLSALKKLKNFIPFTLRKQMAQFLLLSKIDFNDFIYSPLPKSDINKLCRLQRVIASFVCNKYVTKSEIIKLKWLPIEERRDFKILKMIHKAIHNPAWPAINKITTQCSSRITRSADDIRILPSKINGTFQDQAAKLFNKLPSGIRNESNYNSFRMKVKSILFDQAMAKSFSNES